MRTEHGARMVINAHIPSRREVELAIQALEIEDEREKEAMRKFYARYREQKPGLQVTWRGLFAGLLISAGILLAIWAFVTGMFSLG